MTNVERISSGIAGLDTLMYGGLIKNTVTSIVGSSGTGKTTFALSYIYQGLLEGDHILYLSFEETPSKLIAEAKSLGIDFESISPDIMNVIHLVESEKIVEFMTNILPALAQKLKHQNVKHTRIVLDPLTPFLWEFTSEKEQRKILTKVYQHLSALGTVIQTVEEPNAFGQTDIGANETRVPIYLSDTVVHVQNLGLGGKFNRTCKVMKSRRTAHHEGIYPIEFVYGPGIVIDASGIQDDLENSSKYDIRHQDVISRIKLWTKSKDKKKRMIADIATNLLARQDKYEFSKNIELVEKLTDPELVHEVKL